LNLPVSDSLRDKDSYLWQCKYQIGLVLDIFSKLKLGFFTSPIVAASYLETRIAKFEIRGETDFSFWGQKIMEGESARNGY